MKKLIKFVGDFLRSEVRRGPLWLQIVVAVMLIVMTVSLATLLSAANCMEPWRGTPYHNHVRWRPFSCQVEIGGRWMPATTIREMP